MSGTVDYYKVLGLNQDCDQYSIKRAYRSAARRLHPDLPANKGSREAAREFRQVREAYEVLTDPERRRRYDLYGRDGGVFGVGQGRSGPAAEPGFELRTRAGEGVASIFADLFAVDDNIKAQTRRSAPSPWNPADLGAAQREDLPGSGRSVDSTGARGRTEPQHPFGFDPEALAEAALAGDLAEADSPFVRSEQLPSRELATGGEPVNIPTNGAAGPGALDGDELRVAVCIPFLVAAVGGRHEVSYRVPDAAGEWRVECFDIAVPAGTQSGMESRCRERGHFGVGGGRRGDAVLELQVASHPWFRRSGFDVYLDLPLSPAEAAAGCQLDVPTVRGGVGVRVPAGVHTGQQIRLRGQGLDGGPVRGHQILCVQVQLSTELSQEHIEVLRKMDEETCFNPRSGLWPTEQEEAGQSAAES